jgi:asparagine synthase (glutamine-hydrolysing)
MIAGWIELGQRQDNAGAPELAEHAGSRRATGSGWEVSVSGREADLALHSGCVVACEGRPRFADPTVQRTARDGSAARAWLDLLRDQGERGLASVAGEFAVVFIDLKGGRALAASDRFAVRPLCYAMEGGRFAFASRVDAVPINGARTIDPQAIYDYLYFHVIPSPRTIFRGIHRVRPAFLVRATARGAETAAHWTPRFAPVRAPLARLEEEFRTLVRDAVAREMDGRRIGCFLSGGTDSSTVTGMLVRLSGSAQAYSIGFDSQGYDEMEYARLAARHFGAQHHEYYITPADLVAGIPNVAAHYDQPFGNSSALPAFYCSRLAASEGIERMLAGDGGDELFGGNSRYAKQRVFEVYHALPAGLRSAVVEPLLIGSDFWSRVPLVRKVASYVRQARLSMPDRMETYNLLERLGVSTALAPAFLEQVDTGLPLREEREVYRETSAGFVDTMLAFDWKYTLGDNDLPKVCGTAALAGIEVGFPFLNDEICDFSLRLPQHLKVRGLTLRYFFKRALREFLPVEILRKRKHGFGLPFGPWLLQHQALHQIAADSLADLAGRGVVRREFIDELMKQRVAEVPGYYGGMVWVLMMLEQWLRRHANEFRI